MSCADQDVGVGGNGSCYSKKIFFFTHKVELPKISLGLFDLGPHSLCYQHKVQSTNI